MSTWRAKSISFRVSPRTRLKLTVRRFRTARQHRAPRQLVIPIDDSTIRELAISYRRLAGRRRRAASAPNWRLAGLLPTAVIAVGLIGAGVSGLQLGQKKSIEPATSFASAKPAVAKSYPSLPYAVPTHLDISSQNISAKVISVGLNSDGSIAMPPLFSWDVGWYHLGPAPGQIGPAVIVGHVDNYKNISVFWRLRYVKAGDKIIIQRADGSTATFKVTGLAQYDQDNFPTEKVYGNVPDAELRLITCGGTFDHTTHHYTQNTVVTAVLDQPTSPAATAKH